jgi:hypothetical protein
MVKAIAKRLRRLEDQFASANGKPRTVFRMMLSPTVRPGLEGATCYRDLCADGTVSECIVLGTSSNGRAITDDELETWVESFPIEVPDGRMYLRPIPPPGGRDSAPLPKAG